MSPPELTGRSAFSLGVESLLKPTNSIKSIQYVVVKDRPLNYELLRCDL